MAYRVLSSGDAFWRPSNQMKVENTDLAKQLGAETLGARFWRLQPGQASTKHRALRDARALRPDRGRGTRARGRRGAGAPSDVGAAGGAGARSAALQRHRYGLALADRGSTPGGGVEHPGDERGAARSDVSGRAE